MVSSQSRPLYLMVKPPRPVADRIALGVRCTQTAPQLHMTLLPLGDRRHYSDHAFAGLIEAVERLQLFAFRLVFDGIHESTSTVAMRGSERIEGAETFHGALRGALARQGIASPVGYRFQPHITLSYERDGFGSSAILPISWLVEDFRLIESIHGERRHVEHARVPLLTPVSMAA